LGSLQWANESKHYFSDMDYDPKTISETTTSHSGRRSHHLPGGDGDWNLKWRLTDFFTNIKDQIENFAVET